MLRRISISNYLLIDSLELELQAGFTVLTGETGSGKSMLLDALQLALGQRADSSCLRDPAKRCIIELEVDASHLSTWFIENDVPFDLITSIRRHIEVNGRSRAFVNDTPVKLDVLKNFASALIHMHSQHQTRLLNDRSTLLGMLDRSAGLEKNHAAYTSAFDTWSASMKELEQLKERGSSPELDVDYLRFQLDELDSAALRGGELKQLEYDLSKAENAEALSTTCERINDSLNGETGMLASLYELQKKASSFSETDEAFKVFADRLESAYLELKDLNNDVEVHGQSLDLDPSRAGQLRERLDLIHRLLLKHRLQSEKELLELRDSITEKLDQASATEKRLNELEGSCELEFETVKRLGEELGRLRAQASPGLEKKITDQLKQLGIPKARFRLDLDQTSPDRLGTDGITALFAADPDRPLGDLKQVASGGELSRVMLALISPTAKAMGVETIIFDEIDTGVSGEVADKVGGILSAMSSGTQILAISHLPQVASKAHQHIHVVKTSSAAGTVSQFLSLDPEDRIKAIAEMLSGSSTSTAALQNARELLAFPE